MRHNIKKKHLGRSTSHRRAMLSNLVTALLRNGRIRTTEAKAKEGRRLAERMVTFAKKGDLHARRQTLRVIRDREVVKRLFDEIGPRFQDRQGGYTRITKLDPRLGDCAPMVLLELLDETKSETKKGAKKSSDTSAESKKKKAAVKKTKAKAKTNAKAQPKVKAADTKSKETQPASADDQPKKKKRSKKTSEKK